MRFFGLLLVIGLIAAPAMAQTDGGGRIFGTANCPQHLSCPGDNTFSISPVAAAANACVSQFFGYSSPDGLFDEASGVNSLNCLAAKPNVLPKGMGAQLAPRCCLMPQAGYCTLHCDIVTQ